MHDVGVVESYARGWSAFFHWVGELRASLVRQLVVSLVICGVLAALGMRAELRPEARVVAGVYIWGSVVAAVVPSHVMTLRDAEGVWQGTASEEVAGLSKAFGGRPCSFMLWQWVLRFKVVY